MARIAPRRPLAWLRLSIERGLRAHSQFFRPRRRGSGQEGEEPGGTPQTQVVRMVGGFHHTGPFSGEGGGPRLALAPNIEARPTEGGVADRCGIVNISSPPPPVKSGGSGRPHSALHVRSDSRRPCWVESNTNRSDRSLASRTASGYWVTRAEWWPRGRGKGAVFQ